MRSTKCNNTCRYFHHHKTLEGTICISNFEPKYYPI